MADFYRLVVKLGIGSGTITINGTEPEVYYEAGTTVNVVCTLDPGFVFFQWVANGVEISTSSSFSFTMPTRDYYITGFALGNASPDNGYGLLFFGEVPDMYDQATLRLEIYQDQYVGSATEQHIRDLFINFGDNEKNLTTTILGTSLDFTLFGNGYDYSVFLTGDDRTFRVKLLRNGSTVFDGYLTPDFIEFDDLGNDQYYSFVAIDGLKGFDSYKIKPNLFPGKTVGVPDLALIAILGGLNQTFVEKKKVNFICNIHEDRMDSNTLVFSQFYTPESAVFTDGERVKFENGNTVYNENVSISEALESLLKPFLCRVFQWDNEFWIVRIPDMYATTMTALRYLPDNSFDASVLIANDTDANCKISPKPRIRTGRVYTEFTALLNLGVLELAARGSVIQVKFGIDDWYVAPPGSQYPNRYVLKLWDYINARPSNQPSSVPTGETALIQYAANGGDEQCKIWTTTTTSGLSDPNLSSILLTTRDFGFILADELVNTMSFELEYLVLPTAPSSTSNTIANHSVAIQVKVGDYYLRESLTPEVYEFTLTPEFCVFPVPNINTYNKIVITKVVIPTTDFIEISLYQLILSSGTRHQFAVSFKNLKLSVEENQSLTLSQLGAKGVTTDQYSSVFPDYETSIGDARSIMSSSAIRLTSTGTPVSESWTAKDFISLPLLGGIVQDLANLYGRTNRVLRGTLYGVEIKPYESFVYDGILWVMLSFRWNLHRNSYEFEAFELGEITST